MITDDLKTRYSDGTLDWYLSTVVDRCLLNNYLVELDELIKQQKEILIYNKNNASIQRSIYNLLIVREKVYNRMAQYKPIIS